jgi:hypothetical protein
MISKSFKENFELGRKLPSLRNKGIIPKIHLEKIKNIESPLKSHAESFVSINIYSSKSPSTYREATGKSTGTVVESTGVPKNVLCSGCSLAANDCEIF